MIKGESRGGHHAPPHGYGKWHHWACTNEIVGSVLRHLVELQMPRDQTLRLASSRLLFQFV